MPLLPSAKGLPALCGTEGGLSPSRPSGAYLRQPFLAHGAGSRQPVPPPPPQHPQSGLQGTSSRRPGLLSVSSRAPEATALGRGAGAEGWHRATTSPTLRKGALRLVLRIRSMTAREDKCQRPPPKTEVSIRGSLVLTKPSDGLGITCTRLFL